MADSEANASSSILASEQIANAFLEIAGRPKGAQRATYLTLHEDETNAINAAQKLALHCRETLALMFDAQQTRGSPHLLVSVMLSRAAEIREILDLYLKSTDIDSA